MLQITLCLALMTSTSLGHHIDNHIDVVDIVSLDVDPTEPPAVDNHRGAIVFEANFGHTTLRYYRYEEHSLSSLLFDNMRQVNSTKVAGGIHRFKDGLTYKGQTIREYLQPLMTFAQDVHNTEADYHAGHVASQHQPADHHVMLLATAGMRLLEVEESQPIIDEVRRLLSDSSFNIFGFSGNHSARILSGEEQAALGWVAVNYLEGSFTSTGPAESVGFMEMGHESTQIAFVPDEAIKAGFYRFRLGGVAHELYVHSYEQYGIGGMTDIMAEDFTVLSKASDTSIAEVHNTCWVMGFNGTRTFVNGTKVKHVGWGNPMECMKVIQKHLFTPIDIELDLNLCTEEKCRVRNVYQPDLPQNMTFYATNGFEHVANDLDWRFDVDGAHSNVHVGVLGDDGVTLNVINLMREGFKYCNLTVEEVRVLYPHIQEEHIGKRCMMALYLSNLLTAYDVIEANDHVKATTKVDTQPITWALGAVVIDTYEKLSDLAAEGHYVHSDQQQMNYVHDAHNTAYNRGYAYGWPRASVNNNQ